MSVNPFGHIDLRVKDAGKAAAFYSKLLPELGFTRIFHGGGWRVFATEGELPQAAYFALTEILGTYYAVFFTDPSGNRLEVYHRLN